ncbi:uncharacterized protein [Henckelia pumila]|uniref:uncharacterized protein n=1 Tax=Henckelia pumila TaxID=405737 RepID=UPI003C6E03F3
MVFGWYCFIVCKVILDAGSLLESEHEKDKLVGEVIRYILFKSEQTSGCPIKRDELTQLITGKYYRQRNLPAFVINEAKAKLSLIFGYEMRELQRSRPSVSANPVRASHNRCWNLTEFESRINQLPPNFQFFQHLQMLCFNSFFNAAISDAKSYIIMSQIPPDIYRKFVEDANSTHLTGFTFVVVGIIHLACGRVAEENLWHHLRRMGLQENQENHPNFGNTKQALEALVQQRYLQKEKVNGPEGNTVYYELAERALETSTNDKVKEYISQIVQKDGNPMEADLFSLFASSSYKVFG